MIKRLGNLILNRCGYRITGLQEWNSINVDSEPKTLIDIGCAQATPDLYRCFPNTPVLMIDPLKEYEDGMQRSSRANGGAYELVAVGAREGSTEINVNVDRPLRSSLCRRSEITTTEHQYEVRQVPIRTLDTLMEKHNFKPPFGLKIDTEGYELEVLKGGAQTLMNCCFVILETSVQQRFKDSYTFEEILSFMIEREFRVKNVLSAEADKDGLVRYIDLLFVPSNASE